MEPRRAKVIGYSTKELSSSSPGGPVDFDRPTFAQTVVYVAELIGGPPGAPLVHGDSGGAVTQTTATRTRLHSLVGASAWISDDGGVTKRWFVLLIPIHFVVAQIAKLLRDQRMGASGGPASGCPDVAWTLTQELSRAYEAV